MKNKFKRFMPLLMAVFLAFMVMPFSSFAASIDLLSGKTMYIGSGLDSNKYSETHVTDNNVNTSTSMLQKSGSGMEWIWYKFPSPVSITSFSYYLNSGVSSATLFFYDSNKTSLYNTTLSANSASHVVNLSLSNVSYVAVRNNDTTFSAILADLKVFGPAPVIHDNVTGLSGNADQTNVNLSWYNPSTNPDLTGFKIYQDSTLIKTLTDKTVNSYKVTGLSPNTNHAFQVVATYTDSIDSSGTSINVTTLPYADVTNLTSTVGKTTAKLNWTNPTTSGFTGLQIYQGSTLIQTINDTTTTNYSVTGLTAGTNYSFKVVSLYSSASSNGAVSSITTGTPPTDVNNLKATANGKTVNLTWTNPTDPDVKSLQIYQGTTLINTISDLSQTSYTVSGLNYKTNYDFTVIAIYSDTQSPGVKTSVMTPDAPIPPNISGDSLTKLPNGDYLYKWQQPTTGNIQISSGGQTITSVPSSQGQVTIPKDKVKTDSVGDATIQATPTGETGLQGPSKTATTGFSTVTNPLNLVDVLKAGMSLIWLIGPLLLLALAFLFVPKLRRILFSAFKGKNKGDSLPNTRRTGEGKEGQEETKRERIERPEREPKTLIQREPREREERELRVRNIKPTVIKDRELTRAERKTRERVKTPRTERAPRERMKTERPQREPRTRRT